MVHKSRVLVIDIDGVACEHAKSVCSWVERQYGICTVARDVKSWNHDFGPITFIEAVNICYRDPDFIMSMEVTPGFIDFLTSVEKQMVVKFASTRKVSYSTTRLWLTRSIGEYDIEFVNRKVDVLFDFLVDDHPEECIKAAERRKTSFLYSRPWNQDSFTGKTLKRYGNVYAVESFRDIIDLLKQQ